MIGHAAPRALVDAASAPYRRAGGWPYLRARGKLSADPAFAAILRLGLLKQRQHILDLGCGQGLLAAWLLAAHSCYARGDWPASWPAPPSRNYLPAWPCWPVISCGGSHGLTRTYVTSVSVGAT